MTDTRYFKFDTYESSTEWGRSHWIDFDKTTTPAMKSLLECFVGKVIGEGSERTVFASRYDPNVVIKVGKGYSTQNAVEASTWDRFKDYPKISKWIAPVLQRSADCRVIVQRRTSTLVKPPAKIPDFLGDLKVQNFGLLDGQVVAHDYGLGIYLDPGSTFTLIKPEWWDGQTGDYYDR